MDTTTQTALLNRLDTHPIKLTTAQARPLLRTLGQADGYKGRKFRLKAQASYTLNNGDLCWDGGSKTEVTFVRVRDGRMEVVDARDAMACAVTQGPQTFTAPIPADVIIVERSWFCGRDMGYTFIVGTATPAAALAHWFYLGAAQYAAARQLTSGAE